MEEIKRHHEILDAGRPQQKPVCPNWTENDDCRDQVILKGEVVRVGLKLGTEDRLPPVRLRQCRCSRHGYFREYAPFTLPNKHYVSVRVDEALRCAVEGKSVDDFCCNSGIQDACTPRRWIAQWTVRLEHTAEVLDRWLHRLSRHRAGVALPVAKSPPPAWSWRAAWECMQEAMADFPVALAPPLSYLALKA